MRMGENASSRSEPLDLDDTPSPATLHIALTACAISHDRLREGRCNAALDTATVRSLLDSNNTLYRCNSDIKNVLVDIADLLRTQNKSARYDSSSSDGSESDNQAASEHAPSTAAFSEVRHALDTDSVRKMIAGSGISDEGAGWYEPLSIDAGKEQDDLYRRTYKSEDHHRQIF